ncbi:hypothetical protein ROA7450_03353 [Roseovarius albus]|uniref:Apea-like HEPN domain-containing protein n=1 Tax=Roseovarius albus TaxID=1247867 RepID=A0A1X6ZXC5_9RHOB|nr:hypothetical protein [Roseovarius albus]SLN63824.1 hypothetical protein ROA7450_03353 [Roseovarius albus]
MPQIHFILKASLHEYVFNPFRPEGLSFTDEANGLEIQIKCRGDESDSDFGHRNLELIAKVSRDATERQTNFVETLVVERIVKPDETPLNLPHFLGNDEVIDLNGKIAPGYGPNVDILPRKLRELCVSTGKEMERHAIRFLQLLRWLEKVPGPEKIGYGPDIRGGLYWRTTQENYHAVPRRKRDAFTLLVGEGLKWSDETQRNFTQLWSNTGQQEPLGHQLLREAKNIADQNHRSALLICYSALEIGVKQHISKCAPDASWLAMYSPSPPLFNILRNYLPELHSGKRDFENWSEIKSELNLVYDFTQDRNRLAHRGESIEGSLENYLRITEDLLYAFDVFEGHGWAKKQVSYKFAKLMDWGPIGGGGYLTLHDPEQ